MADESKAGQPKYAVGDYLRYSDGPTAWFCVTDIKANHGGVGNHRYWGRHMLGGVVGAYEDQIVEKRTSPPTARRDGRDG
jgi:hypothetical protein